MQWTDRIGRRIKLRDLHVLLATIEFGSMARAAKSLSVSQPVVSKTIAGLENSLGLRLLDRTRQGVEPTAYGRALLACGTAVFDDLRRGIQEIEFLADPTRGKLRVGGAGPFIEGLIPAVVARIAERYPRIDFRVLESDAGTLCRLLQEHKLDLAICRPPEAIDKTDLTSERLFDETMTVIAGLESPWSARRKINLADLLNEPWVLPESDNVAASLVADTFRIARLKPPKPQVVSNSVAVRMRLVETSKFLTIVPASMLHFGAERLHVKRLPINLPIAPSPAEIITLKNRTPNAVAHIFLDELRTFVKIGALRSNGIGVRCCEGFRMPAAQCGLANTGGRRPKASREGNRGKGYGELRALWRFERDGWWD